MQYRDLIPSRLDGSIIASHIRIPDGGPVPELVHYHTVGFQLIYCSKVVANRTFHWRRAMLLLFHRRWYIDTPTAARIWSFWKSPCPVFLKRKLEPIRTDDASSRVGELKWGQGCHVCFGSICCRFWFESPGNSADPRGQGSGVCPF